MHPRKSSPIPDEALFESIGEAIQGSTHGAFPVKPHLYGVERRNFLIGLRYDVRLGELLQGVGLPWSL